MLSTKCTSDTGHWQNVCSKLWNWSLIVYLYYFVLSFLDVRCSLRIISDKYCKIKKENCHLSINNDVLNDYVYVRHRHGQNVRPTLYVRHRIKSLISLRKNLPAFYFFLIQSENVVFYMFLWEKYRFGLILHRVSKKHNSTFYVCPFFVRPTPWYIWVISSLIKIAKFSNFVWVKYNPGLTSEYTYIDDTIKNDDMGKVQSLQNVRPNLRNCPYILYF